MWSIKELEVNDLMSFSSAVYQFKGGVVTTIYGDNKDNDSQQSNGSGKSALLEAVAMGLTGTPLRKIKNGEIVKNGEKSCHISLTLTNSQTGEIMDIERIIYPKKSAVVFVKINGEEYKEVTNTDSVNQFILDKIGISRDDLFNYFILSATRFEPFLNASDTKKKDTINRFSNGDMVDGAIEDLDQDLEEAEAEADEKATQVRVIEGKIEVTNESIREALSQEDEGDDIDEKIKGYEESKSKTRKALENVEKELVNIQEDLVEIKDELKNFDSENGLDYCKAQMEDLQKQYDEVVSYITTERDKLDKVRSRIKSLNIQLGETIVCPECSYEFDAADSDFNPDEAKKELDKLVKEESDIITTGKGLNKDKKLIEEGMSECESQIDSILSDKRELSEEMVDVENELRSAISKQDRLKLDIQHYDSLIKDAHEVNNDSVYDNLTPLVNKVNDLEKQLLPLSKDLAEVKQEVEELITQKDLFKRFKTHLANKSIRSIEILANDYLESIGSDISIKLSGVSKLASGATRDKIDATLIRDGIELGSFNKNSNGEKARINLAIILTFNKLINLNAGDGRGLNLLIIDEILDASDAEGLMAMIRAMNKLGTTVLMVSHGAVHENYEHSITIQKENGVSKIIE